MAYNKLLSLRWLATTDSAYGATDGRRLLLNPNGLMNLLRTSNPVGHTAFLLVHESLHALLNHGSRLKKFADHKTANIAADYIINWLIKEANTKAMNTHGLNRPPFPFIAGCLLDENMDSSKSVEELYQILRAAEDESDPDGPSGPTTHDSDDDDDDAGCGSGDDSPSDTDSDDSTTGDATDDTDEDTDGDDNGGASSFGSDDAETDDEILGHKWVGSEGGTDTLPPEVPLGDQTEQDVERAIAQENERIVLQDELNQAVGMGGSSGRVDIGHHAHDTPAQRWQDLIRDWMTSRTAGGWNKPCNVPLYQSTKLISAGRQDNAIGTWVMVVDTSGSMGQRTLQNVLAQIQDAIDTLGPRKTIILPVDSSVHEPYEVQGKGGVPLTLGGGGGTKFQPAFDYIDEHYPDADGIVYLTDGHAWDWPHLTPPANNIPLLWLTYGKPEDAYPFGDAIEVELYA